MIAGKSKPKRSRASAPKVRTGCLTCKTRHLKCGEEKPICLRCRTDGFTCDGYLQSVVISTPARKKPKTVYVPWLPPPTSVIDRGSELERKFLHHVQQTTIQDLAFTSTRLDFWNRLVLAPAQTSEAVRHALVALGAAHWLFLSRPSNPPMLQETAKLEHLILQQYNMAIQDLTARMGESGTTDLHLTLACCLIFFSLESMMGRYAESLQHLRAGSRLLAHPSKSPMSRESTPSSFESDDAICEMAQTFSTLGVNASMFLDEPIVDDLSLYNRVTPEFSSPGTLFTDLTDARRQMSAVEVEFNLGMESSNQDMDAPQMQHVFQRLREWASRFDKSDAQLQRAIQTQAERYEYLALRLSRRLWHSVLSSPSPADSDEVFVEVLDLAETLCQRGPNSHPVFTIQADVVPALNFICDTSDEVPIQRRAIDLLRSMRRREGIWDSQEVAEYLEDSLIARKMLRQGWDDVIGGIPGAARALSSMTLSTLSPNNGILLMAKKTLAAQD